MKKFLLNLKTVIIGMVIGLCLMANGSAWGQGVSAVYDNSSKTITITNHRENSIFLFHEKKKSENNMDMTENGQDFEACGFKISAASGYSTSRKLLAIEGKSLKQIKCEENPKTIIVYERYERAGDKGAQKRYKQLQKISITETFTITYNPDGGILNPSATKITKENKQEIQLPNVTKEGHNFKNWKSSNGQEYDANAKYTVTSDISFTAQWEKQTESKNEVSETTDQSSGVTSNPTFSSTSNTANKEKQTKPSQPDYTQQIINLETQTNTLRYILSLELTEENRNQLIKDKDSVITVKLLQEIGDLLNLFSTGKIKQSEYEQLKKIKSSLTEIKLQIDIILSGISKEDAAFLPQLFNERFLDKIKAQLMPVEKFIETQNNKSSWYKWFGKWKYEKILYTLESDSADYINNCTQFIDSLVNIPKYSNAKTVLLGKKEELKGKLNEIKINKEILKARFAIPYLQLSIMGALILITIAIVVIFIGINRRNQKIAKKEAEKKRELEKKLGKSKFKKISAALTNNETEDKAALNPKIKQLLKQYEHGLSEVKADVGRTYKEIDMFDLVEDSSIHKVYLSRDLIKELYRFFSEFLKSDGKVPETGCYIIGRWEYAPNTEEQAYNISLEYLVKPGRDATYSEYTCNFGAEIGISLIMENRKYSEQVNIEYVHTSWMHSHPGLQLFLSSQDLIVQSTLTNNSPYKRMLAIVIDTKTENFEMAFFTPKSGTQNVMNNDKDIKKTLMLEELYKWAKTLYDESQKIESKKETESNVETINASAKEYFDIPLKKATTEIKTVQITRAASVDMSSLNQGCLYGTVRDGQLFIDKIEESALENQNLEQGQAGLFKEIANFENDKEWDKCREILMEESFWKSSKIVVVYCLQDENLYLFTEKVNNKEIETENLPNKSTIIPFQNLKKWTREKRNL